MVTNICTPGDATTLKTISVTKKLFPNRRYSDFLVNTLDQDWKVKKYPLI